jgi:hypothetical protein
VASDIHQGGLEISARNRRSKNSKSLPRVARTLWRLRDQLSSRKRDLFVEWIAASASLFSIFSMKSHTIGRDRVIAVWQFDN